MKGNKILNIFLASLILFFIAGHFSYSIAQVKAEKGILDLRNEDIRHKIIKLNGEWEFYWKKHLQPADFKNTHNILLPNAWADIPSYWTDLSEEIPEIEKTGYATYRLTILLPDNIRTLVFDIPVFDSSFRIYIDGKYAGSNGLAGTREEESKAGYNPFTYECKVQNGKAEVIINVSNFHHRRGGFWLPMRIGRPETIYKNIETDKSISYISYGILLSFVSFFFIFYLLFRRDNSMLFFSVATLGIFLRGISTEPYLIQTFFDINWTWIIRIEYTGTFIMLISASWYFYKIYPDKIYKLFCTIISVLFILSIILVLISPVILFANSVRIFYPSVIIILLYYGIKSIVSLIRNANSTGFLNTIGFLALLMAAGNDIALSRSGDGIFGLYILPYATTIFIFTQVILLIIRWVDSFNHEKRLLKDLEYVNKNLENIVIERTTELTNQKLELIKQKAETEKKNEEFEKNIHIKNRIFSIIAHDLKSPLISLAMLIENLKNNKNNKDEFEKTENEMLRQVHFTNNLIENLLMWGHGQQNQINYKPDKWNITDIVLECFNLLYPNSESKQIQLSYSHKGSSIAWCDRDLVSIILRNLISNAIKFTPVKGKVLVTAEEVTPVNPSLRVSVKDTGTGIDKKTLTDLMSDRITESKRGTAGEKGTGLGLQLCKDLVKVNSGELKIESDEGIGTTVSFTLPVKK